MQPGKRSDLRRAHRGVDPASALYPLAYLQQGRARILEGKIDDARRSYERFLDLWKDADSDLPILLEAQQEHAQLGLQPHE